MDFVLQKATELGVSEFILFNAKRSIIRFDITKENKKIERWERICKEAAEQSKRCDIPNIRVVSKLSDLKELDGIKLICSTIEINNSLKKVLQVNKNCVKISIYKKKLVLIIVMKAIIYPVITIHVKDNVIMIVIYIIILHHMSVLIIVMKLVTN